MAAQTMATTATQIAVRATRADRKDGILVLKPGIDISNVYQSL
jgi:hypothetical protein